MSHRYPFLDRYLNNVSPVIIFQYAENFNISQWRPLKINFVRFLLSSCISQSVSLYFCFQVDLGKNTLVSAVALQGRPNPRSIMYVTKYNVLYSIDPTTSTLMTVMSGSIARVRYFFSPVSVYCQLKDWNCRGSYFARSFSLISFIEN